MIIDIIAETFTFVYRVFINSTGISCKEKIRKDNFQMCLSLSFHDYKIVFKDRISTPLKT